MVALLNLSVKFVMGIVLKNARENVIRVIRARNLSCA